VHIQKGPCTTKRPILPENKIDISGEKILDFMSFPQTTTMCSEIVFQRSNYLHIYREAAKL
jgi:hypothetical protein